jgi:hypothetical protein
MRKKKGVKQKEEEKGGFIMEELGFIKVGFHIAN